MIDRRAFLGTLAGGLLAAPLVVEAQQAGKVPRVGYLLPVAMASRNEPFLEGLRRLGYVPGQNVITELRYAEGRPERYAELAAELVRLNVDIIVADGSTATAAAKKATTRIPIVTVAGGDLVEQGLIKSLRQPGGNITGLSTNSPTLSGKRLELCREFLPKLSRLAVLWMATNPGHPAFLKETEAAARTLRVHVDSVAIQNVSDLEAAFSAIVRGKAEAILLTEDPNLSSQQRRIATLAIEKKLPMISGFRQYTAAGGLMSYGSSISEMFRRTAEYVDKILKGTPPGELPVEEPTKFELVINLKTAKALGLTIPPSLLARADEVIE